MTPATQRKNRMAWRIRWAEEELRTFDREIVSAWRSARSIIATAMAATGCDGQKASAGDHLNDMFSDVFGDERARLLAALDEQGGDVSAYPWPIEEDET